MDAPTVATVRCSFCHKPDTAVGAMVAGPGVYICDQCVSLCGAVIEAKPPGRAPRLAPWDRVDDRATVLAQLLPMARVAAEVDQTLRGWVGRARALGASWQEVGDALGVTRQSAWERFARPAGASE